MGKRQVSFKINNDLDEWVKSQTESGEEKAPFESVSDLVNTALQYYKNRKEFDKILEGTILSFVKDDPGIKEEIEKAIQKVVSHKFQ